MYADFTPADTSPDPVTIGGIVRGLDDESSGLSLYLINGGELKPIFKNGEFTFDTLLTPGNWYGVIVGTNPKDPDQDCVVENGFGKVSEDNVTNVVVTCGVPSPDPVTIGGTVSGLVGSSLVMQNTGRDNEPIFNNGDFTFKEPRTPGTFHDVTVLSNPTNPAQTCSVANGSGTVPNEPVIDVAVTCDEPILGNIT